MRAEGISVEWLQSIDFDIKPSHDCPTIVGVVVRDLAVHLDGRGEVTELWSRLWRQEDIVEVEHAYQSATDYGVVKCWHLHQSHTDQLVVTRGKLQVTLVDLRHDSPTFGHVNALFLGVQKPRLVKIPPMILHGWKALSRPEVIVVNFQSEVYSPADEYRFPWDCILAHVWEPKNG